MNAEERAEREQADADVLERAAGIGGRLRVAEDRLRAMTPAELEREYRRSSR